MGIDFFMPSLYYELENTGLSLHQRGIPMSWMDYVFHITEIIGTIAFAISGAMVACKKRMDLFGVLFLGGVTALGGGTIRDVLLGHFPPNMFYSFKFLLIAAVSALNRILFQYFMM